MRRLHLFEIEDQPWCPRAVRDGGTDWLHFMESTHKTFDPIAPKLREAMRRGGCERIVDLCSGGGGPWGSLVPLLARSGSVQVELTDLFPNATAPDRLVGECRGRIRYHTEPV